MKRYLVSFVIGFVACGAAFLLLDFTVMKLMGLTLIFHP